jgi:hypothetical protein
MSILSLPNAAGHIIFRSMRLDYDLVIYYYPTRADANRTRRTPPDSYGSCACRTLLDLALLAVSMVAPFSLLYAAHFTFT